MAHIFRSLYDQTRCIGCNACQMACKDEKDLEPGLFFRRVETIQYEEDGEAICVHYSGSCNHCLEAACVKACPVGAMVRKEDGSVGQEAGRCIGCGACTWACPYGAVSLSHKLGIARKCDSCADRRSSGKAPACVAACPTHCLTYRLEEEESLGVGEGERAAHSSGEADIEDLYGAPDLPYLPDPALTKPALRIRKKGGGRG